MAGSIDSAAALEARARASLGASSDAIYRAVVELLDARGICGGVLVDVGCGRGDLRRHVAGRFAHWIGLDAVRYDALPDEVEFHGVDLDASSWPLDGVVGDVVVAVETIEHLENPWAFVRSLAQITRPGGHVVLTTPNQLSALSLLTLMVKQRFSAFQDSMYPTHRTALLESDLRRLAAAAGLVDVEVSYTAQGRWPLSGVHYPRALARACPRWCSDNVALIGRRPDA